MHRCQFCSFEIFGGLYFFFSKPLSFCLFCLLSSYLQNLSFLTHTPASYYFLPTKPLINFNTFISRYIYTYLSIFLNLSTILDTLFTPKLIIQFLYSSLYFQQHEFHYLTSFFSTSLNFIYYISFFQKYSNTLCDRKAAAIPLFSIYPKTRIYYLQSACRHSTSQSVEAQILPTCGKSNRKKTLIFHSNQNWNINTSYYTGFRN